MTFSMFVCDPEAALFAQLSAECEQWEREWQREEDDDEDAVLAAEFMEDPDAVDWPWWLDAPYEVQEPEIFIP